MQSQARRVTELGRKQGWKPSTPALYAHGQGQTAGRGETSRGKAPLPTDQEALEAAPGAGAAEEGRAQAAGGDLEASPPERPPPQPSPHTGPHGASWHRTLTGPMLMHLEKRSSAAMCSYSLWTARWRRLALWWRSYRLSNAAGARSSAQHSPGALPTPPSPRPSPTSRVETRPGHSRAVTGTGPAQKTRAGHAGAGVRTLKPPGFPQGDGPRPGPWTQGTERAPRPAAPTPLRDPSLRLAPGARTALALDVKHNGCPPTPVTTGPKQRGVRKGRRLGHSARAARHPAQAPTIHHAEQPAVRRVQLVGGHAAPVRRPVDAGVVLHVELLGGSTSASCSPASSPGMP